MYLSPRVLTTMAFNRSLSSIDVSLTSIILTKSNILIPCPTGIVYTEHISKFDSLFGSNWSREKWCILFVFDVLFTSILFMPSLKSKVSVGDTCHELIKYSGFLDREIIKSSAQRPCTVFVEDCPICLNRSIIFSISSIRIF